MSCEEKNFARSMELQEMSLFSFNWNNQQNALAALTDQLNHLLGHHGFQRVSKREWERNREWIIDGVYLSVRQAPTWDFDAHLITYLPYTPPDNEWKEPRLIHAQANGATFVGHDDAFIKLPKFSLQISGFVKRTVQEIEHSLTWFDQFDTPSQCLADVDRIHKPGCLAHKWATEYLQSLLHQKTKAC